jgi:hypothetical protein
MLILSPKCVTPIGVCTLVDNTAESTVVGTTRATFPHFPQGFTQISIVQNEASNLA